MRPPPVSYASTPSESACESLMGTYSSAFSPFGRQKPMSQKGMDAAMTGSVASATSTPSPRWTAAAAPTEAASPPAVHASVRAESLPTTFSVYSPMSLWTVTLSISGPLTPGARRCRACRSRPPRRR